MEFDSECWNIAGSLGLMLGSESSRWRTCTNLDCEVMGRVASGSRSVSKHCVHDGLVLEEVAVDVPEQ